jgi:hypothetical protein
MKSLRPSAYLCVLCVKSNLNAEDAEIRRGPQRRDNTSGAMIPTDKSCALLATHCALAKLAWSGAGREAECFREVTAAQVAHARADLRYRKIGICE